MADKTGINRVITIKIDKEQLDLDLTMKYLVWEEQFIEYLLLKFKEQKLEVFIETSDEEYSLTEGEDG
jgi:hypothetical protein